MKREDFISNVLDKGYEWAECSHGGKEGYAIRKDQAKLFISFEGIDAQDWDTIKKGIPDLTHMTRIVGYYSKVHNWNKSKIGELRDRQKGDYAVNRS